MKKGMMSLVCAVVLLGGSVVYADEAPGVVDDRALAEVYDLLETMHMKQSYDTTLKRMFQSRAAMLPPSLSQNKKFMDGYKSFLSNFTKKYLSWGAIKEDVAALYARHYTVKEIKDIKAFYLTTTGQKSLKIMPQIAVESMKITQSKLIPHMGEMEEAITKLVQENIKKK